MGQNKKETETESLDRSRTNMLKWWAVSILALQTSGLCLTSSYIFPEGMWRNILEGGTFLTLGIFALSTIAAFKNSIEVWKHILKKK